MPNKNLGSFSLSEKIFPNPNFSAFSHELAIYKKKKNEKLWYVKSLDSKIDLAISEIIAQELFRLILPNHPKTRCVEKKLSEGNRYHYYVASKEIENIDPLYFLDEKKYSKDMANGKIKGLGSVQVISLWLNEIDFKPGNVVVNEEGNVIKLDGGLCFASKLNIPHYEKKIMFDITSQDLQELPALVNYTPYNWLDFITHREKETTHERITNLDSPLLNIKNNDNFKHEVHQTTLRIISLPDVLIDYFVRNYVSNGEIAIPLIDNIIERKQQLKKAAFEMENFRIYLSSFKALEEIKKYISYLKTFKTTGKLFLLNDLKNGHKIDIEEKVYEEFLIAKGCSVIKELSNNLALFNPRYSVKNVEKINYIIKKLGCICENHLKFTKQIQAFEDNLKNVHFPCKDSFLFSMNSLINRLNTLKRAPIPYPRNSSAFFPKIKVRKKLITMQEMLGTELDQISLGYNHLLN